MSNLNFFAYKATYSFASFAQIENLQMEIRQRYITGIAFLIISVAVQAQSLRSYIKDDMKKELLKQMNPNLSPSVPTMQQSPSRGAKAQNEDILDYYNKHKAGSVLDIDPDKKYKISPNLTKYTGKDPINKLPDGHVEPIFHLGQWHLGNPSNRVDGLVSPSGLNLSGWKKKKLSEKSKKILINVYNMTLDNDL